MHTRIKEQLNGEALSRVAENAATTLALSADEVSDLNAAADRTGVVGNRYNDAGMAMVGR